MAAKSGNIFKEYKSLGKIWKSLPLKVCCQQIYNFRDTIDGELKKHPV